MKLKFDNYEKYITGTMEVQKYDLRCIEIVAKAVSDDPSRLYMCVMFYDYDDKVLVGTDGRRLHIHRLSPGLINQFPKYSCPVRYVKGSLIFYEHDSIGQFPNYKRVIPDNEDMKISDKVYPLFTKKQARARDFRGGSEDYVNFILPRMILDMGFVTNLDYLMDAVGQNYNLKVQKVEKNRPFVLFNEFMTVVIMPYTSDDAFINAEWGNMEVPDAGKEKER